MPKNSNFIEILRKAKTYNKFIILRLLLDKKHRESYEIVQELKKSEKILRSTILVALESLEKDDLIILDEYDRYTINIDKFPFLNI